MKIRSLDELARDVAPARDLWPGIEARLDADEPPRAATRVRRPWRGAALGGLTLAAAVAFVAVGLWLGRASAPAPTDHGEAMLRSAAFSPGPQFAAERNRLRSDLAARVAALPPDSRREVIVSLEAIDRSMTEIKRALGEDPGSLLLQEMLVNAYQDEINTLTTVSEAGFAGEET
jgi:hypothetical protein